MLSCAATFFGCLGFTSSRRKGPRPSAIIEYLNQEKINVEPQRYGCVRFVVCSGLAFQLWRKHEHFFAGSQLPGFRVYRWHGCSASEGSILPNYGGGAYDF